MRSLLTTVLLGMLIGADADRHFGTRRSQTHRDPPRRAARRATPSQYLNNRTAEFVVNGTNIPLYSHDLGESYAGLLPIAHEYRVDPNGTDARELFFWFFPSDNPAATDEITIWLTGGPGCSSLVAWNKLTNIVYIEQPVGVGFTQGTPGLLKDEADVAREFLGFWKNFVDAFNLHGRKILVAGESYAGYYIPYITDAMLNADDTRFFNVDGAFMIDPLIGERDAAFQVPQLAMARNFPQLFPFNATFEKQITAVDKTCGFTAFLDEYLVFPAKSVQPPAPTSDGGCDMFDTLLDGMAFLNPCFSSYHITETCPFPADPILNPPDGVEYFNRSDVKAAINAPQTSWAVCLLGVFGGNVDTSKPPNVDALPRVIERLNKTLIVSGALDLELPTNGTLLAIQNMTWNGALGFQNKPFKEQFFVPYVTAATVGDSQGNLWPLAGTGLMGTSHTERGLTFVEVFLAGHQEPQWQPAAAFRQLEWMLGRVESMSGMEDWTVTIN
ncbi:Carboxypeptidase [Mycena venus]|uniref:Carboxypeptidase n=1 Tax=Mycena venus TaxID=2733690 RepID=A0A8H6XXL5_9AGAR|nr:Carboxypeptidase [Mycena venus]